MFTKIDKGSSQNIIFGERFIVLLVFFITVNMVRIPNI